MDTYSSEDCLHVMYSKEFDPRLGLRLLLCQQLTVVRMASSPVDPLQTLQAALTVQANSKEQADLLATLRESLENHPAPIPILAGTLIGIVVHANDSLLKRWVIDLLHFAICRSTLSLDQRTQS